MVDCCIWHIGRGCLKKNTEKKEKNFINDILLLKTVTAILKIMLFSFFVEMKYLGN
jgi:hypothetical protein